MTCQHNALAGVICLLLGCGAGGTAFAEDSPRLLASQCAQCHGTEGHSIGDIDDLAGKGRKIIKEMMEMQAETPDDIMEHQARGYTMEQIRLVAQYYDSISSAYTPGYPDINTNGSDSTGDSDHSSTSDHKDDSDTREESDHEHGHHRDSDKDRKSRRYLEDD